MPRFHIGICTAILFALFICSQSASRFLEKQEAQAHIHAAKAPIKAPAAKAPVPIKAPEAKPNFLVRTQANAKSNIDTQAWFESDLMAEGEKVETKAKVESKIAAAHPAGKHLATTEWFDIDETPWAGDATASDAKSHHFVIKAESKSKHVAASHAHANDIMTKHADSSIDSHLKKAAESDSDVAEMLKFEKSAESESGDAEGNDKAPEADSSDEGASLQQTQKSVNFWEINGTSLQQAQKSVNSDDDDDAEESVHAEKDLSRAVVAAASALSHLNTLAAPDVDSKSTAHADQLGTYDDSWHNKPISLAHYDSLSHDDHTLHEDDEHFAHESHDDHLPPLPKHLQGHLQKRHATMHSDYEDYSDDGSESLLSMGDHEDFQYDENAHDKMHDDDHHSMDMGDMDDLTHDHYSDAGEDHDHSDDSYDSDNYDDDDEDPGL